MMLLACSVPSSVTHTAFPFRQQASSFARPPPISRDLEIQQRGRQRTAQLEGQDQDGRMANVSPSELYGIVGMATTVWPCSIPDIAPNIESSRSPLQEGNSVACTVQ